MYDVLLIVIVLHLLWYSMNVELKNDVCVNECVCVCEVCDSVQILCWGNKYGKGCNSKAEKYI